MLAPRVLRLLATSVLLVSAISCSKSTPPDTNSDATGASETNESSSSTAESKASSSQAKTKKKMTACSVVSQQELKDITGIDFPHATSQGNITVGASCDLQSADRKHNMGIAILPHNGQSKIDSERQFPKFESIEGLGDEAVWVADMGALTVRRGKKAVSVRLSPSIGDAKTRLESAKKIVKLIFDRT